MPIFIEYMYKILFPSFTFLKKSWEELGKNLGRTWEELGKNLGRIWEEAYKNQNTLKLNNFNKASLAKKGIVSQKYFQMTAQF